MSMAKLTSKGQITLPVTVRKALGVSAGDRVEFIEEDGKFIMRASSHEAKNLKGLIERPAKAVSIEEMNAAIRHRGAGK